MNSHLKDTSFQQAKKPPIHVNKDINSSLMTSHIHLITMSVDGHYCVK